MSLKVKKVKTVANLEAGDCRWPIGDPRHEGFHFCGAKQVEGRPYCAHHTEVSYIPGKLRQQGAGAPVLPQLVKPALINRRAA